MKFIDSTKLSHWFNTYGKVLVHYARQWLSMESAEDVVQEAFVQLLLQKGEPANVKAWLFRSVRNAALNKARSIRHRHKYERRRAANHPAWFQTSPEDLLDAAAAQSVLLSLPHEQREIIMLRIWAGMTLEEASEVIGHPVSTLFSRYRAGLSALQKAMEASCEIQKD